MIRIALVVAMARNGIIGDKGTLPWRISDDLKWFKKTTLGKPVIMGRKTFDSIGKPLPGRDNIVVTRSDDWSADGVIRTRSVAEALSVAKERAAGAGIDEVCVIGGGKVFAETLPVANRIYLTVVEAEVAGDVRFPPFHRSDWAETSAGGCDKGPRNDFACRFFVLDRRQS